MPKTFREILQEARAQVKELTVQKAKQMLGTPTPPVLLDIREPEEYEAGHVPSALFIPRGFLELRVEDAVPKKDTPVLVQCAGGIRSALAARVLQDMGYSNVYNLAGGFSAWKQAGFEVEVSPKSGPKKSDRYSRHIRMPEVGELGQAKLLRSRALLVGAGGLGSPAAFYLAAAGVGTLGIIDADVVDESNLQRQILHSTLDIGRKKTDSARETLKKLNPDIQVETYPVRIDSSNAREILRGYDVVLNGCDNFPTRYLINDAAFFEKKPVVDGSIFRFEGQATVYVPGKGPCYRCLFPEPPPPEMAPSCDEAGVFGVLPGIVGLIQATETIKLLLGLGESLVGRLLLFDALSMKFREVRVQRNPACPLCGEHPTVKTLIDYEEFCSRAAMAAAG